MEIKDKKRDEISRLDLLIHLVVKIKKDDIFALASQQSYYLIMAFFPFVISLASLVGYIGPRTIDSWVYDKYPKNYKIAA